MARFATAATVATAVVVVLPLPAYASSISTVTADATGARAVAAAMGVPSTGVYQTNGLPDVAFDIAPGAADGTAGTPVGAFPTGSSSSFGVLTTGHGTLADATTSAGDSGFSDNVSSDAGTAGGTAGYVAGKPNRAHVFDPSVLNLHLRVPAGASCVAFDYAFFSNEVPRFVGTVGNDAFVAELDNSTWTTSNYGVVAPNDFALDPQGKLVSVNTAGADGTMRQQFASGTGYSAATPVLTASAPVTAGDHRLYLSLFEQGTDGFYDSAVFISNFRFTAGTGANCAAGAASAITNPIQNLTVGVSPSSVPAGHEKVDTNAIPANALDGATNSGTPLAAAPYRTTALSHSSPLSHSSALSHSSPLSHSSAVDTPFGGTPLTQSPLSTLVNAGIGDQPLSSVPLLGGKTWAEVLAGSVLGDQPLQGVTLGQVFGYASSHPHPDVTGDTIRALLLADVDNTQTILREASLSAVLLGSTPESRLPPGTGGTGNSLLYDEVVGHLRFTDYLASTPIVLNGLALANDSPLLTMRARNIWFPATALARASLASLSSVQGFIDTSKCSAPSCTTLGDASTNDAIRSGLSLSALLADGNLPGITLAGLIPGLLPDSELPFGQVALPDLLTAAAQDHTVTWTASFTLDCSAAAGLGVTTHLPAGFTPVQETLNIDGQVFSSLTAQAGADPLTTTWTPTTPVICSGTKLGSFAMTAVASSVVGRASLTVDVTGSFGGSSATGGQVDVTTAGESHDPLLPVAVTSGTLRLGHLATAGDVDYYQVTPLAPGTNVTVTLSHAPVDSDLVVYGAGPANLPPAVSLALSHSSPLSHSSALSHSSPVEDPRSNSSTDVTDLPPAGLGGVPLLGNKVVLGVSDNRGVADESVTVTQQSSAPLLIQVSGYNDSGDPRPFVLGVASDEPPPPVACAPRPAWQLSPLATLASPASLPAVPSGKKTLILVNERRLAAEYGDITTTLADLAALAAAPNVNGVVVPVDADSTTSTDYADWDAHGCSVDAADKVVADITGLIHSYAAGDPALQYVVFAGDDEQIPMGRVPDLTTVSNESSYAGGVRFAQLENPMSAALAAGDVLTDDVYTATSPLPWIGGALYAPSLVSGRLVETPGDIHQAVQDFLTSGGHRNPTGAAVAGYDFVSDGASAVADALGGFGTVTHLSGTWTRSDALGAWGTDAGGVVAIFGHYDQHRALTGYGNSHPDDGVYSAGNLVTTGDLPLTGTADAAFAGADLSNSIVFTLGCHAGLSVDDSLGSGAATQDWAQTVGHAHGVFVGNTGYGYGDDHSVAFSERLMADFATNLSAGNQSLGQALAFAKQAYLGLGATSVYDAKAMEEATLYGLPMYVIGSSGTEAPPATATGSTVPGQQRLDYSGQLQQRTDTTSGQSYFQVGDEAPQVTPFEPLEPRDVVTLGPTPTGKLLHGVTIDSLSSTDHTSFPAQYDQPTVDLASAEPPTASTTFFPSTLATAFTRPTPQGQTDFVVVTPGQFAASGAGDGTGLQRNYPQLAVTPKYDVEAESDWTPPSLDSSVAYVDGTGAHFVISWSGDPLTQAFVLWLGPTTGPQTPWTNTPLAAGPVSADHGTLSADVAGATTVRQYIVELVDAHGNVAMSAPKFLDSITRAQAPSMTLSASPAAPAVGQATILTANLPETAPGAVTFTGPNGPLGTAPAVDGVASVIATFTAGGDQPVSASYSGGVDADGTFWTPTSAAATVSVGKQPVQLSYSGMTQVQFGLDLPVSASLVRASDGSVVADATVRFTFGSGVSAPSFPGVYDSATGLYKTTIPASALGAAANVALIVHATESSTSANSALADATTVARVTVISRQLTVTTNGLGTAAGQYKLGSSTGGGSVTATASVTPVIGSVASLSPTPRVDFWVYKASNVGRGTPDWTVLTTASASASSITYTATITSPATDILTVVPHVVGPVDVSGLVDYTAPTGAPLPIAFVPSVTGRWSAGGGTVTSGGVTDAFGFRAAYANGAVKPAGPVTDIWKGSDGNWYELLATSMTSGNQQASGAKKASMSGLGTVVVVDPVTGAPTGGGGSSYGWTLNVLDAATDTYSIVITNPGRTTVFHQAGTTTTLLPVSGSIVVNQK